MNIILQYLSDICTLELIVLFNDSMVWMKIEFIPSREEAERVVNMQMTFVHKKQE